MYKEHMQSRLQKLGFSFTALLMVFSTPFAQMQSGNTKHDSSEIRMQGPMGNNGMQGHCPMCGRQWDGSNNYTPTIPDSLSVPQNKQWIKRLNDVLALERLSRKQYQKDEKKHNIRMPYGMIIPQEENHIEWISDLYNAFGKQPPDSVPPTQETTSAASALQTGMRLEEELIPDYEWLIKNAETATVKQLLGDILYQTRMHFTMFQHALSMGGMMR